MVTAIVIVLGAAVVGVQLVVEYYGDCVRGME